MTLVKSYESARRQDKLTSWKTGQPSSSLKSIHSATNLTSVSLLRMPDPTPHSCNVDGMGAPLVFFKKTCVPTRTASQHWIPRGRVRKGVPTKLKLSLLPGWRYRVGGAMWRSRVQGEYYMKYIHIYIYIYTYILELPNAPWRSLPLPGAPCRSWAFPGAVWRSLALPGAHHVYIWDLRVQTVCDLWYIRTDRYTDRHTDRCDLWYRRTDC